MYRIIGADGQPYGPVDINQIRRWMSENRVRGETLVQMEGAVEWRPLSTFPELMADFKGLPPVTAPPPSSLISSRASNKIPAGVCGILLGSFGVHKFILGYTGTGLIMLLVTLVGGFLTCGLASGVMYIIGIIEGIVYLSKSDEDFVRTYVDHEKSWF